MRSAGAGATGASRYLAVVGPADGFFGLGLALYFAAQGAGRLAWSLAAGCLRLLIAALGGWLRGLFGAIALAHGVFGLTVARAIRAGAWR